VRVKGTVAASVPAEYGEMLRMLTETIASGRGSRPNDTVQQVTGAPPTKFAEHRVRRRAILGGINYEYWTATAA
jgi:hypothetical protein